MRNKTCCGFGHRSLFVQSAYEQIKSVLEKLIVEENVFTFFTGGMGEFDAMFSAAVRSIEKYNKQIELVLVKPYYSNEINVDKEHYNYYYDSFIIPEALIAAHPKSAITKRNYWMIDNSDFVISLI